MPKRFFKRYSPSPSEVRNKRWMRPFIKYLGHPGLWHFSRRSVSRGFGIGIFWAFFPFPSQLLYFVLSAIPSRANIPVGFVAVMITNPLTIPPMFTATYLVGTQMLGVEPVAIPDEMTWRWFGDSLQQIWPSLLIGSISTGIVIGLLSYIIIDLLWMTSVQKRWKKRAQQRMKAKADIT